MLKCVDDLMKLFSNRAQIQDMLRESELCFKIEAYRAALLFAFSAFIRALKIKIIENGKPSDIDESAWNSLCEGLESDDRMESKVMECVQRPNFFDISQALRQSVIYWKDRRNACAHWKDECINMELVESFYYFILHNQYKFSLKTSADNAIKEIFSVFDADVCRPGTSVEPKIKILPYLLNDGDIDGFCKQLIEKCIFTTNEKQKNVIQVIELILRLGGEKYRTALVNKLRTQYQIIGIIVDGSPNILSLILENKEEYKLCLTDHYIEGKHRQKIAKILSDRNLLDDELFEHFFNATLENDKNGISEYDTFLMKKCGEKFIANVIDGKIDGSEYLYINDRADLIYQFLLNTPVDGRFVQCIVLLFSKANYSQWLIERFFYNGDDRKKLIYDLETFSSTNNIPLPSPLARAIAEHKLV